MKSRILRIFCALAMVLLVFQGACLAGAGSSNNKIVAITSLKAELDNVYPQGNSEITAVVSAPQGGTVQYEWSTDGGAIIGDGATVHWESPNEYGDFHVMLTARDIAGDSDQATLTMHVVPRPIRQCCGRTYKF